MLSDEYIDGYITTIPRIGIGTSIDFEALHTGSAIADSQNRQNALDKMRLNIRHAIKKGYRHFDTAVLYQTSHILAEEINMSGIDRGNFFVTIKYQNTPVSYEVDAKEFKGYIDLALLHSPPLSDDPRTFQKEFIREWGKYDGLKKNKFARDVGISNFYPTQVRLAFEAISEYNLSHEEKMCFPFANQLEINVMYQAYDDVEICKEYGMTLIAHTSLKSLCEEKISSKIKKISNQLKPNKCSPAQLIIAWLLSRGIKVVIGSKNNEHLSENLKSTEFVSSISASVKAEIQKLSVERPLAQISITSMDYDKSLEKKLQQKISHGNV